MSDLLSGHLTTLAVVVGVVLALLSGGHAVLHKRDPRAAVSWVGVIALAPFVGAAFYWVFGVNRIRRRASALRRRSALGSVVPNAALDDPSEVLRALGDDHAHLAALAHATRRLAARALTHGNAIEPLENGEEAYPAMLAAIDEAQHTVALATYIFDNDAVGQRFVDALSRANARGVTVRVLVDAVGALYSWPSILHKLARAGVPAAKFLPISRSPLAALFVNLRSHRKVLVVDGRVGFTGGMNIRKGHMLSEQPKSPVRDLQFRVKGPLVSQLMQCFAEDWAFSTGEALGGERWFPMLAPEGDVLARAITDGPDDDFEVLRHVLLAAVACARHSVRVVTPYFVPDTALITALNVAALRGVRVDIVVPEHGNIAIAQWASTALLWQVLQKGCRVYRSPRPFDHTKLVIVDEAWVAFGSTNWDARSLRLNFELDVECFDRDLARELAALTDARIRAAHEYTLSDVDGRPLAIRLRDGIAKLFAPYL